MKLYRLKIDGVSFDPIASYTDEQLDGNKPFVASEETPVYGDYADISSIENWDLYGSKLGKDYKRWRDHLGRVMKDMAVASTLGTENDDTNIVSPSVDDSYLVGLEAINGFAGKEAKIAIWNGTTWDFKEKQEVGFDLCTPTEQLILTEHKFGTHTQRVATVGFENTMALGLAYNAKAVLVRQKRLMVAHGLVHNYLPNNAKMLFGESKISDVEYVVNRYVTYGVEGSMAGDGCAGISDWLHGLGVYTGEGFVDYPRTPEGGITMTQLAGAAWDVIHNGNY